MFYDYRPVGGGQPGEIIRIGSLYHTTAGFDCHRHRMGVGEQRRGRAVLSKDGPDEAGQIAIGVTK